jgi:hypothetical protein
MLILSLIQHTITDSGTSATTPSNTNPKKRYPSSLHFFTSRPRNFSLRVILNQQPLAVFAYSSAGADNLTPSPYERDA